MPLSADVRVGDRMRVYGTLSLPHAFETDGGRTFRYDKYLQARDIRFLIQYGSIYTVEPAPWYSVPAALARIKHAFLDGLNLALPHPDAALAGGIVIGGKEGLGTELKDAFTRSGLVQIIVLSGYNVMIVAEWIMALFALSFAPPASVLCRRGGAPPLCWHRRYLCHGSTRRDHGGDCTLCARDRQELRRESRAPLHGSPHAHVESSLPRL